MDGALVLAGGASTRMGRDKAWLDWGGRPLLVFVVEILASRCRPIVIAARPGQELPELDRDGVARVDDPEPGGGPAGPLVGIVEGLAWLARAGVERAYLGSSDAVGLSAAHIAFMLEQLDADGCDAAVPRGGDGQLHPLASAVRVAPILARARAQLAADQPRLRTLFTGERICVIEAAALPDARVLTPCNTPQEWADAQRSGES